MLAHGFLFLGARTRNAVTFRTGDHVPFFRHVGVIGRFLGRHVVFLAHQFMPRLRPVRLGELVRVALIYHGDFSSASFHFLL